MDSMFGELKNNLDVDLTYQEFYREICAMVAKIKCQHTVATPESSTLNQIIKRGKFFPLPVYWEFDTLKAYAEADFSSEVSLPMGTRILSINGLSVESIYSTLIPYFPSDGDILTNKHSRLEHGFDFQLWYYLLIDQSSSYIVELENTTGERFSKTYNPVTLREWTRNYRKYISQKDQEVRKLTDHYVVIEKKNRSTPIRYEFLSDDVALLTLGNFLSQEFNAVVSEAFKRLKEKKSNNLIIDVRNNGGGDDRKGAYLFTYLINEPTKYFDSIYANAIIPDTAFLFEHTDKNVDWFMGNRKKVYLMEDGRLATKPEFDPGLLVQQPHENSFQGNVYILMNGRSASTTAEFTAAVHFNNLATFIGEESGGAYHGGHGGDFAALSLPNTSIEVQIPLAKYVMNSKEDRFVERGTIPDYVIQSTIQDILNLKDAQLEFTLTLIKKE